MGGERDTDKFSRTLTEINGTLSKLCGLLEKLEPLAEAAEPEAPKSGGLTFIVNINGRRQRMTEDQVQAIDPEQFDLFLDLTSGTIRARIPGETSPLRRIADTPLQAEDLNTLVVLVEHPGRLFSHENLPQFTEGATYLQPNTLAKRLGRIRKAVQNGRLDGPFIRRTSDAHYTVSGSGFAFYFDSVGTSYCLVMYAKPA